MPARREKGSQTQRDMSGWVRERKGSVRMRLQINQCDLMLRNYATFEGAFAHAYTSHGRIQGLLAKMVASGTMRA